MATATRIVRAPAVAPAAARTAATVAAPRGAASAPIRTARAARRAGSRRADEIDAEPREEAPRQRDEDGDLHRVAEHGQGRQHGAHRVVEDEVPAEREQHRQGGGGGQHRGVPPAPPVHEAREDEARRGQPEIERGEERLTALEHLALHRRRDGHRTPEPGQRQLGQGRGMNRPVGPDLPRQRAPAGARGELEGWASTARRTDRRPGRPPRPPTPSFVVSGRRPARPAPGRRGPPPPPSPRPSPPCRTSRRGPGRRAPRRARARSARRAPRRRPARRQAPRAARPRRRSGATGWSGRRRARRPSTTPRWRDRPSGCRRAPGHGLVRAGPGEREVGEHEQRVVPPRTDIRRLIQVGGYATCALELASSGWPKPTVRSHSGHEPAATARTNASASACQ